MSIAKIIFDGRLIKDPEHRSYGEKTLVTFTVACDVGWGDKKKILFFNCTAFGKTGDAIIKFIHKGDGIFIAGQPTQNKKDDKVYHGVIVQEWSFGPKKKSDSSSSSSDNESHYGQSNDDSPSDSSSSSSDNESHYGQSNDDSPFDDSEIPF